MAANVDTMRRTENKIHVVNEDGRVAEEVVKGGHDDMDFVASNPARCIHFNPANEDFQSYLHDE